MKLFAFLPAAHCIRGPNILKNGFVADYVRLGEHDFRTEMDCEDVNISVECYDC